MENDPLIYVAGHRGMVGSALLRCLRRHGFNRLVTRSHSELDLTKQAEVASFFRTERPEVVLLAAARVGGILANSTYAAEFISINLQIQSNVIDAAWRCGVHQLVFLASSCIYPRDCPQPMSEEMLWTGPLEPTNAPYAVAKLAGIEMCKAYRKQYGVNFSSVIPTNLYGIGDNFDPEQSHLVAALIRKFHRAKVEGERKVVLWGSGTPLREVMFVDDLAEACTFLLKLPDFPDPINIGLGSDKSVAEIASLVADKVGYRGQIGFDPEMPDGAPRKLLDIRRLRSLGWDCTTALEDGLTATYRWFLGNCS